MAKKKITSKKTPLPRAQKLKNYELEGTEFTEADYKITLYDAKVSFMLDRLNRGNSKATLAAYERFFLKYREFYNDILKRQGIAATGDDGLKASPVRLLQSPLDQTAFVTKLGNVSQQTINHYLRSYRAFGNYCEEAGFITGFKCSIKEVEPPAKEVYTKKELQALIAKPKITDFTDFRNYTVIMLLLSTAARVSSIINANIEDVDLDEGYITYQKTKTHKVLRIGLEKGALLALRQFIEYYRTEDSYGLPIAPTEALFCNEYGERITRGGLYKGICSYAKARGVKRTGLHLFRHTYAKEWITSGGDTLSLKRVLGHSDMTMVNRYANLYDTDVKEEILEHSPLAQMKRKSGASLNSKYKK